MKTKPKKAKPLPKTTPDPTRYIIRRHGRKEGPFTRQDIELLLQAGLIDKCVYGAALRKFGFLT